MRSAAARRERRNQYGQIRSFHSRSGFEEKVIAPRKPSSSCRYRMDPILKFGELLGLQQPLSRPAHHDEMLFIVIHQVYELWFKQVLHEIDAISAALDDGDLLKVGKHFKRVHTIQRLLVQQVDILETMTPHDFNQFRDNLNPASGFQSVQFRELEFACGVRRTEVLQYVELDDASARAPHSARKKRPSLYDRLKGQLRKRGFAVETHDELIETFRRIYSDERANRDLYFLLEELIDFDENFLIWRDRHVRMVERMIGHRRGTGGSSGARTCSRRCSIASSPNSGKCAIISVKAATDDRASRRVSDLGKTRRTW